MKVCSPDRLVVEVDGLSGRRYSMRKGIAEMGQRDGKALIAQGGFEASLSGTSNSAIGYRCDSCGFRPFFSHCSRCGSPAVKEG